MDTENFKHGILPISKMKLLKWISLSFLILIASCNYYNDWIEIDTDSCDIFYESLFFSPDHYLKGLKSPEPEIIELTGKGKFLKYGRNYQFGYIMEIQITSIDSVNGNSYQIKFNYQLKDKDGFVIKELSDNDYKSISSLKNNLIQNKITTIIDKEDLKILNSICLKSITIGEK